MFVFVFDISSSLWSPDGKGMYLEFYHFPIRCPRSGVVLDCVDS